MTSPLSPVLTALVAVAALAGCASASTPGAEPARSATAASATFAAPSADSSATARTRVTKLLVFVVENHSIDQMQSGMPWLSALADRYGYATRYHAITHPSLPNYLAIAGGDTYGITDDNPPSSHVIREPSVFGSALRAGRTATTYAEGMTSRCQQDNAGEYAVRHNPWTYFRSEHRLCRHHDVGLGHLRRDVDAGTLPRVGLVVPDVCNDAHDCSLGTADAWLQQHVGEVLDGPDFASGHLAVVVTADEDDTHHGNRVLTVVANPSLDGVVVNRALTHYALSRSLAEAAGIDPIAHAADARSLLRAFGLR